jgi:nucleotide-binding universal stress UspA family protein
VAEPQTDEERDREPLAIQATLERTARETDPTGVQVQIRVQEGAPADVLLAVAGEVDSDLVVVGTRGLRGAARLVLGSVSQTVVSRSSRPVAIVP